MIFSNQSLFSDGQNVAGANAYATNIIDLGETGTPVHGKAALSNDIGKGNFVEFTAQLTAVAAAGAKGLTVNVVTSDTVSGTSLSSPVVLASTTIANGDIVVGTRINLQVLPRGIQRYLSLQYTVDSDTTIDVDITAGINLGTQTNG